MPTLRISLAAFFSSAESARLCRIFNPLFSRKIRTFTFICPVKRNGYFFDCQIWGCNKRAYLAAAAGFFTDSGSVFGILIVNSVP